MAERTGRGNIGGKAGEPVYVRIYKDVLSDIREGRRNPGDRLPSDMDFARSLGVNHLTLKKALNRLAVEGYLNRTPGRGTFIADILPKRYVAGSGKRVALIYDVVHEESFRSDIFMSLYQGAGKLGLNLELLSANDSRTVQFKQVTSLFSDAESAGCIVWPLMDMRQLEHLAAAKPEKYPLVFINHKPELDIRGIDFSGYDDFGSGRKLGEYINQIGFKRCIVCQASEYRKRTTNIHRVAGLKSGLECEPVLVTVRLRKPDRKVFLPLSEFGSDKKTAVVFIGDTEYASAENEIAASGFTPFVFFTSRIPSCRGISLSPKVMAENALKILERRRSGDDSFSIDLRVEGRIV